MIRRLTPTLTWATAVAPASHAPPPADIRASPLPQALNTQTGGMVAIKQVTLRGVSKEQLDLLQLKHVRLELEQRRETLRGQI